jgi:trehalose 6-phosphate synthase
MPRLVVISNRVGLPRERAVAGGLAVALREALAQSGGGLWVGWSGQVREQPDRQAHTQTQGAITYATLDLDLADHDAFYLGYANATLWPLFHFRMGLVEFRCASFEGYRRVNARFAEALGELLRPDDLIWIHDYHFMLLAAELRRRGVRNRIGFFLHIPFPPPEMIETLPGHREILEALCACDVVGLQTGPDAQSLRAVLARHPDIRFDATGAARLGSGVTNIRAFPISIDVETFVRAAQHSAAAKEVGRMRDSLGGRALITGIDRLDYSKGLSLRFDAFEDMLSRYPEHRRYITYLQIATISRGDVPEYRRLRRELDQRAGKINGRFSDIDWTPVRYVNKAAPRAIVAGLLRLSRVGFITPLRDGMNLVAKEFVAAQDGADPGVLVLSSFAGAARELDAALIVNPMDPESVADALHLALVMPLEERVERWRSMMAVLRANDVVNWRTEFLSALAPPAPAIASAVT